MEEQFATPAARRGTAVDRWLLVLVLLLIAAAVGGGVLVWQAREDRVHATAEQERYGAVLAAARAEAEAYINIRYDDAQASLDQVAEGATGEFREQYSSSSERVIESLQRKKTVMEGDVLYVGVVEIDEGSATVLAATSGTVADEATGNQPVARDLRLRLELVLEDGRWLTDDLQLVS